MISVEKNLYQGLRQDQNMVKKLEIQMKKDVRIVKDLYKILIKNKMKKNLYKKNNKFFLNKNKNKSYSINNLKKKRKD